jgi:hypothetical protein
MRGYTIQLKANKRKEVSIKSEHIRLLHEHEAAAQRPKLFDVQDRLDSTRRGLPFWVYFVKSHTQGPM